MASYQVRQRDPLLDSATRTILARRGKELLGLVLAIAGIGFALMMGSYSPDDPSWFSATDAPVGNWLGHPGASLAAPLLMVAGWGVWGIAAIPIIWGVRFMTHHGEERALGRLIFAPIAVALISAHASTLAPPASWPHRDFGLGGLFGDALSAALLSVLQEWGGLAVWLKALSALSGVAMIAMLLFATGFNRRELSSTGRFLLMGLILGYAGLMRLIVRGAVGAMVLARMMNGSRRTRKKAAEEGAGQSRPDGFEAVQARVLRAEPAVSRTAAPLAEGTMDEETAEQTPGPGILGAIFRRRQREPVEPEPTGHDDDMDGDARIRARISDVIKSRGRQPPVIGDTARREPRLTRRSGPEPLVADTMPPVEAPTATPPDPTIREPLPTPEPRVWSGPAHTPPEPDCGVVQHSPRKAIRPSRQARAEAQPALPFEDKANEYECPPLSLLTDPGRIKRHHLSDEALEANARMLENVLDDYGVKGEIVSVRPGPVVTMYELEPAPGLKASRVIGLADDIARSMSALSARVSTVPGRSVIGIELPNEKREMVVLREILAGRAFGDGNHRLPLALGKDIGGEPVVANLARMPHLLIAGTTGSGKSVAINTMILSLLYKLSPKECRMIMIDPKMLELSVYDGIPHLLSPVVTDPKKAVVALKWVVGEMEERYRKMSRMGVRNIDGYNGRVRDALSEGEMFSRTVQTGFDEETGNPIFETEGFAPEIMPFIVVIVDEMADLMMVAGKEIEACIQRLAQMARASGIHLIMATQRPSVDVITGTIKANFPTRISFQVTSKIDSRTILGEMGAEQLLGMGDMLYMAGGSRIARVHGPFCSDVEVEEIVNYLKTYGPPEYVGDVVDGPDEDRESDIDLVLGLGGNTDGEDALYDQAVAIVIKDRKCSTSYIQRKLAVGYNKAARLVEQMEEQGLVSPANHVGKREILAPEQQ